MHGPTAPRAAGRGRGARNPQHQQGSQPAHSAWGTLPQATRPTTSKNSQNGVTKVQVPVVSQKFEDACAKIKENMEKFLPQTPDEDRSSSEEELEAESILSRVVSSYAEVNDGAGDLQRTVPYLTDNLVSGATVCLICIESVKRTEQVWSCDKCYAILHLTCIQKWAKDSMHQQQQQQETDPMSWKPPCWHCPKCRKDYSSREGLSQYRCFCKQKVDPPYDPWLVPHSCGQTCSKELQPLCSHRCLLLCHPGPCPPCPKMVRNGCHCGRAQPTARRCSSRLWSCGGLCGKTLTCGSHPCSQTCHPGDCNACPRKSRQKCQCGASTTDRPCATPNWQCKKVCGKLLSCGQHTCDQVCHSGPCAACPRAGPRACPCGKSKWELPCTEDVGPCGDTCEKLLACDLHRCSQRCHSGPCPPCLQVRPKRCRCGAREKAVPCSRDYTCETKCKRLRDCRRHPCSRKCCEGACPPCEQPCGRTLPCRNHKCPSCCHTGPCYPCRETVEISCPCKSTRVTVPCGRERTAKPPVCTKPCRIPPECHHEKLSPHSCHGGRCPACKQVCNRVLECGHVCRATCHSAVLTKIMPKKTQRAGPWEPLIAPRLEVVSQPCPPCQEPLQLACRGQHSVDSFPCSELRHYSCGLRCGRVLPCGNHRCSIECHVVEDAPDDVRAGKNCSSCEESCQRVRPAGCHHPCTKSCHPEECAPCSQYIKMKCHCGLNPVFVPCHQWTCGSEGDRTALQSCKNRCCKQLECGHRCPLNCHPGSCASQCLKKVTLRCPCKRRKLDGPCHTVKGPLVCDDKCVTQNGIQEVHMETKDHSRQEPEQSGSKSLGQMHIMFALATAVALASLAATFWLVV